MALHTSYWTEGVIPSFDSNNMIDFPATGSAPGKQQCKPGKRIPRGSGPAMEGSQRSPAG